jgi:hypothetical protein
LVVEGVPAAAAPLHRAGQEAVLDITIHQVLRTILAPVVLLVKVMLEVKGKIIVPVLDPGAVAELEL